MSKNIKMSSLVYWVIKSVGKLLFTIIKHSHKFVYKITFLWLMNY